MKKYTNLALLVAVSVSLIGCMGASEKHYSGDYDNYQAGQAECMDRDKHVVRSVDSGGQPQVFEFAAGNCDRIAAPVHSGKFRAQIATASLQAGAGVFSEIVRGEYNENVAELNNEVRIRVAEIQLEEVKDDNQLIRELIGSSTNSVDALIDQNADLIEQLTSEPDDEMTGDDSVGGGTDGDVTGADNGV
jgi:hypothetical protein